MKPGVFAKKKVQFYVLSLQVYDLGFSWSLNNNAYHVKRDVNHFTCSSRDTYNKCDTLYDKYGTLNLKSDTPRDR